MAYGLIYTIPFMTLENEPCVINIEKKDYTGESTELQAGETPFTIDIEDEDFLYTPTRFSTAKIDIVGCDYLQGIYSTSYQEYRVTYQKNGKVRWCGFVKPEAYTQDYVTSKFTLEIECLSALSTLEYIDYAKKEASLQFVSLWYLFWKCISAANGNYTSIYIPYVYSDSEDNYKTDSVNVLENLTISEQNFFDEDGKAMKLKEVLESLCKLLSWTCVDFKGSLYFVDCDHTGDYWVYDGTLATKSGTYTPETLIIQDIGFKGGNHTLDILGGYTKCTVKDSNYNVGDIFPEQKYYVLLEKTGDIDETHEKYGFKPDLEHAGNGLDKDQNIMYYYFGGVEQTEDLVYNFLDYSSNWPALLPYKGLYLSYLHCGSTIMRTTIVEIVEKDGKRTYSTNELSYDNCIAIFMQSATLPDPHNLFPTGTMTLPDGKEVLSFKKDLPLSKYSDGAFFISGNIAQSVDPYFHVCSSVVGSGEEIKLNFSLQIGNYYWNGTEWSTAESKFDITIKKEDTYSQYRSIPDTKVLGQWYSGSNGYIIEIPNELNLMGSPVFKMYTPSVDGNVTAVYLKDFSMKFVKKDSEKKEEENKSDRTYENVVNGEYVNELDEIELKISTYNKDGACYSKVALGNVYLTDNLYSAIESKPVRLEESLIKRIINRYDHTRIKLTQEINNLDELSPISVLSDNYMVNKKFMITGGTIDAAMNKFECKMIEK